MKNKLVLVHTVPQLLEYFDDLCAKLLPDFRALHVLDEPLLERIRQRGTIAPEDSGYLQEIAIVAEQIGAQALLITCSTVSQCVADIRTPAGIPIIKIDEAMIAKAVHEGTKIGVLATNPTTLDPTRQMLQAEAARVKRPIEIQLVLVEHAFEALMGKDAETHDRLVKNAVLELETEVDEIVLAQASTARVLDVLPVEKRQTPILSSPHLALAQVKRVLSGVTISFRK